MRRNGLHPAPCGYPPSYDYKNIDYINEYDGYYIIKNNGYIFLLKGTKDGQISFKNVYASKGINSEFDNVISYNDGTKSAPVALTNKNVKITSST